MIGLGVFLISAILDYFSGVVVSISPNGTITRRKNGKLHGGHRPAVIKPDSCVMYVFDFHERPVLELMRPVAAEFYFVDGQLHRDDGPAYVSADTQIWFKRGKIHREDGPAFICARSQRWIIEGEYHRDGDEPAIIWADGDRYWYKHGLLHRDNDLPARESNGTYQWYFNGALHRDGDKPAIVIVDTGIQIWYLHGNFYRRGAPTIINKSGKIVSYLEDNNKMRNEEYDPEKHDQYMWTSGARTKPALA